MITPFIPKTTAKLKRGDYALLVRSDGRSVPLVFLDHVPNKRNVFYGALLNATTNQPVLEAHGHMLGLYDELAMIDVDAFAYSCAPIIGNISSRLEILQVEAELERQRVRARVWGKAIPLRYANELKTA